MKKLLLIAFGTCLLASCAKNLDDDGPVDASKQKMLMDKAWQLKAYTVNPNIADTNSTPQDEYRNIPDCQKDNYFVFSDEATLLEFDHYQKCLLGDPDTIAYNYVLTNDEKHLTVWANPDDPDNSVIMYGDMTYPSVDSFILTYQVYDPDNEITAEYVKTFLKIVPN